MSLVKNHCSANVRILLSEIYSTSYTLPSPVLSTGASNPLAIITSLITTHFSNGFESTSEFWLLLCNYSASVISFAYIE